MTERVRLALYVQHLLGIGHLRRAAALARAYADAGAEVLVFSGGVPVADIDFGAARLLQLPACLAADAAFSSLLDTEGQAIDSGHFLPEENPQATLAALKPFLTRVMA